MQKFISVFIMCILLTQGAKAYEYSSHYNEPTRNLQVQNDFSEYMQNIKEKLNRNWSHPDFLENGHIKVLFKLDRKGNVISGDILESSGNPVYDESAIDAIHKSEPFGDFPANSTRQSITINYSFDMSLVKTDTMKNYYDLAKKYAYSDKKEALKYINLAIAEVRGDCESYFLYKKRGQIKESLGDHVGAKEDFDEYKKLKTKVDIKRIHALKHRAESEDSAFAYYHLAYAYEQIKDYEGAIWAINKAIERTELNQSYKRYRTELIKVYEHL